MQTLNHSMPAPALTLRERAASLARLCVSSLGKLAPLLDLSIRLMVAEVFFKSGLTKIASWENTIALFENEYSVPLLPPEVAALMGTGGELILPVLLVLGLGSRFAALGLFVLNIVAVISYPELGEIGLKDHHTWGLLLLVTLLHGPGKLSLDHLIGRRLFGDRHVG